MNRFLIAALLFGCAFDSTANAQFNDSDINLFFRQQSIGGGEVEYTVEVDAFSFFFGSGGRLTAPGGTVFDSFDESVDGLSFQDVNDLFFGDWIVSQFDFIIGAQATHTFSVTPFLSDVFSEIPTITSPVASGEEITLAADPIAGGGFGADFNLEWAYPSGAIPSSRILFRANPGGGGSSSVSFVSGSNSLLFSGVLDPGVVSTVFAPRVGTFERVDSFVSAVVPDDPNNTNSLTAGATFENISQAATITLEASPNCLLGDVDLNGVINLLDIQPFIEILSVGGFQCEADCDLNGVVSFLDIQPFIEILSGQ